MDGTKLFIVCGPPGVGKGMVLTRLAADHELNLTRALSITTRPPGPGERDGIDYHFVSAIEFSRLRCTGGLFGGTAQQFGFDYGVKIRDITGPRERGRSVLMESNLNGVALAKGTFDGVVAIFLRPPSAAELRRRLVARARDDAAGLHLRLVEGERMMEEVEHYEIDYFVTNVSLHRCLRELKGIVLNELGRVPPERWKLSG